MNSAEHSNPGRNTLPLSKFHEPSTSRSDVPKSNADKAELNVRVQKARGGKGGKTVTVITGLELEVAEARVLLKRLKARCGAGGTAREDFIELQGDQVAVLLDLLRKEGYRPKKSGG